MLRCEIKRLNIFLVGRFIQTIQALRKKHPNLGKEKIYPLLKAFCEQHHFPCPRPRTIGRIIADAPDKMRMTPVRIRPTGKKIPYKRNTHHRFASMARIGCLATSIKNHDKFRVT